MSVELSCQIIHYWRRGILGHTHTLQGWNWNTFEWIEIHTFCDVNYLTGKDLGWHIHAQENIIKQY